MAVADDHDPAVPPRPSRSQWPMPRGLASPAPSVPLAVADAPPPRPARPARPARRGRCPAAPPRLSRSPSSASHTAIARPRAAAVSVAQPAGSPPSTSPASSPRHRVHASEGARETWSRR
ncbi:hypothetical protein ACQJBY_042137 [Aegilops geniculata]